MYQWTAARYIRRSNADVYHCRSGYGGATIALAREKGMKVIVDHSIIHPQALMQSLAQRGNYDVFHPVELPPMWQLVQNDLEASDCILVNSDYVKQTLVDFGIPEKNIIVRYLGIDSDLEEYLRKHKRVVRDPYAPVRFLFAGGVGLRKGADTLLDAVHHLPKGGWSLTVAGGIEAPLANRVKSFRHPSVKFLGAVLRTRLFQLMLEHDVFVFPTLAEGSARVVFEAMGTGMSVITTPNAGSVVKNDQHGYIISPGDAASLHEAMMLAVQNPRIMRDYGTAASDYLHVHHNSGVYQDAIVTLYHKV
jgi:glycosyltransferase involved in cell wall biosynthesis